MKELTIFTPTYNRSRYLEICYSSLLRQSSKDFIWQIVDDGSTDNTKELIESFVQEAKIPIQYYKKENGGKASAINKSLVLTKTKYWMCLDSDDYLLNDAVERILIECNKIDGEDSVCGVFCVRSSSSQKPMTGKDVPIKVKYATQNQVRFQYKVNPEYVQVYKTDIIRKYPFPLFDGEKFITESWQQDQIDQQYKFLIFHYPVMVCEYLPDGYTNHYYELIKHNPKGFRQFYAQRARIIPFIRQKVLAAMFYNAVFGLCDDRNNNNREKGFLFLLTVIPGYILRKLKLS